MEEGCTIKKITVQKEFDPELFIASLKVYTESFKNNFLTKVKNARNKEAQWVKGLEELKSIQKEFTKSELPLLLRTYSEYEGDIHERKLIVKFLAEIQENRELQKPVDYDKLGEPFSFNSYYCEDHIKMLGFKKELLEDKLNQKLSFQEIWAIGKISKRYENSWPIIKNALKSNDIWNNLFLYKSRIYDSSNQLLRTIEYDYDFFEDFILWDLDFSKPENVVKCYFLYINYGGTIKENLNNSEKLPPNFINPLGNLNDSECLERLARFIGLKEAERFILLDYTLENGNIKFLEKSKNQFGVPYVETTPVLTLNSEFAPATIEKSEEQIIELETSKSKPKAPKTEWKGTQGELLAQLISLKYAGYLSGSLADIRKAVNILLPGTDWLISDSVRTIRKRLRETKRDTPIDIYDKVEAEKRVGYLAFLNGVEEDELETKPSNSKK